MECNKVQEERPSAETSGGQSEGIAGVDCWVEGADFLGLEPVMANQADTSVQVRHLRAHFSCYSLASCNSMQRCDAHCSWRMFTHGLPSGPSTTPLGSVLATGCCSASRVSGVSTGAGPIFALPHACRVVLVSWLFDVVV